MPRNGSGTYSQPANTAAVANQTASSTAFNTLISDIGDEITASLPVAGTKAMAAALPMGSNKITGMADGTALTDAATIKNVQNRTVSFIDGGGTADAITATYSPAIAAVVDGMTLLVEATAANATTTPTFAPNGLTARTIKKLHNQALVAGDISGDGHVLVLQYHASGTYWNLLNPATIAAASESAAGAVELATTAEAEAGTDTARAITAAGLLAAISGQRTMWIPAGAMVSRTTNGAAAGSVETGTNDVMLITKDFDATTSEACQFAVQMPKSWDEGTIVAQFVWKHAATVTNFGVRWGIRAVAFANDDAADTAFGTEQEVTDTGGTTNDIYISDETSAMTVAGTPGAEEWVVFEVYRDPGDAGDTMSIDAGLLGVKIHFTTNAFTDD